MSGLLEEIKQTKPFASLEEEVYLNLQRTAEALSWKVVAALKPAELTPVQYNVLRILRGAAESKSKGLTCKEISERLVTKDSDITRLLDRLEDRELVERARDIEDRRSIVSQITKKGLKLLNELDHLVAACSHQQLNHLGSDLLEQFNALLVLARSNIR
jgi:DNA-binding MarR family transcriptional regulator